MAYKINKDLLAKGLNEVIRERINHLEHAVNDNFSTRIVVQEIAEYSDALKMAEGRIHKEDMKEYLTTGQELIKGYFKK